MQPLQKRHELADCFACPLFDDKNAFVPTKFAEGKSKLVVTGEAPGFQEATRGEPFLGPSGQLLDQVLAHHGYSRREVTYTNACLCRPEGNATPPKAAINACRGRLYDEIIRSGSTDVLALGGTAASVLVNDTRTITHLRIGPAKQPVKQLRDNGVERVVASWHPAYCLRTADAFPALVSDIAKLKDTKRDAWIPPRWKYFDDPVLARLAIAAIHERYSRIVVDIEVGIEKDTAFDHPNEYDLLCVGLAYEKGSAVVIGSGALVDPDVLNDLRNLLQNTSIIAHNGKFDLAGLYPVLGQLTLWFDTMLASYCIDERPGNHGLKVLAVEKLGAPQYDLEIKQYVPKGGNYANIPRELLYKYNAYDVACTWELYELFVPILEREDTRRVHDFLVRASNQLMFLELNGITIDKDYQRELRGIFSKRISDLENALDEIVSEVMYIEEGKGVVDPFDEMQALAEPEDMKQLFPNGINPRSPKQVKTYLESQRVRVESTNEDTLKRLLERVAKDSPVGRFCTTLLRHRRQQKLYSTYVEGIRKRMYKRRVYTTYMLHGTTSGRLASRNPNLQNIVRDKDIRKQFSVSNPENILVQCDYKNAELRVIATLAQDEYLKNLLTNPDPNYKFFNELSDQLYGIGNWDKEKYVRTKAFMYGLCVPTNTKVLTRRGLLPYDEIVAGVDETIGYDFELKKSRWVKIENVLVYDDVPVVRFGGEHVTFETTWNHRWLGQKWQRWKKPRGYGPIDFITTKDIGPDHRLNLAFEFTSDSALDITDQEAAILGWAYSDGSVNFEYKKGSSTTLNITQDKKSPFVQEIDLLISDYSHSRYEYVNNAQIQWRLPSPIANNLLRRAGMFNYPEPEEFAFKLSDSQRKAFWNAVMHAEGVKNNAKKVTQSKGWLLEVIKIMGYLEGFLVRPNFDKFSSKERKDNYKITLGIPYLTGQKLQYENIGRQKVFCLTTETGTWTMQQGRLTVLTGNSYGREPYSIGLEFGMSSKEATQQYNAFMDLIPATAAWQLETRKKVLAGEDLITSFGRRRRFWLITAQNKKDVLNEALSFLPQSTSSDICLSALIDLRPMLRGLGFIRLTIHDAIVVECHEDRKDQVIELMQSVMMRKGRDFTDYVPFPVDASVGKTWGDL